MSKHHLYDESPQISHDLEKGGSKVVKAKKKDEGDGPKEKGVKDEGFKETGMPKHVRHAMERHAMHGRHEVEHSMHDMHGEKHKEAMHERHEKEFKDMHTRHEKEAGAEEGVTTGESAKKVEEGMKGE